VSPTIRVYKTDDYLPDHELDLVEVLSTAFASVVGERAHAVLYRLAFDEVEYHGLTEVEPQVISLQPSHGFILVEIIDTERNTIIYRHPHPADEVIGRPLRDLLVDQDPMETHWGYAVVAPGMSNVQLVRPLPEMDGLHTSHFPVGPITFSVEPIPEPDPPLETFSLGEEWAERGGLAIELDDQTKAWMLNEDTFARDVEEGGFLVGSVARNSAAPEQHVLKISAALPAERTGASLLHFTFSGESFMRLNDALVRRQKGERILGWYHTHLFDATSEMGLSSIDLELHRKTFRQPWQVAGLINLTSARVVLRFYALDQTDVELVNEHVSWSEQ